MRLRLIPSVCQVEIDMQTMKPTETLEKQTKAWVKNVCGRDIETVTELFESEDWPKVEAAITAGIEEANSRAVSNVARIKKWKALRKDFSVDGGELSPTLKLKRFQVTEMYKEEINQMYL